MTGEDAPPVVHDGKPDVQVGIVAQHILHDFIVELIVDELGIIGFEEDIGAVLIL